MNNHQSLDSGTWSSYSTSWHLITFNELALDHIQWAGFQWISMDFSENPLFFKQNCEKLEKHRITSGNKCTISNFRWKSMKINENQWKSSEIHWNPAHWRWSSASSLNVIKCQLIECDRGCLSLSRKLTNEKKMMSNTRQRKRGDEERRSTIVDDISKAELQLWS